MTANIDHSAPVLVTGATGYVAGWLVKRLLEDGRTVHAAVRDPNNEEKVQHLKTLEQQSSGTLKFFKADLLQDGSYAESMEGCQLVYHTASPFTMKVSDPEQELVQPAVAGTRNVLNQAKQTESVCRVIVTSSIVAMCGDNADLAESNSDQLNEDAWNTTSSLDHNPYSYSKVQAEKEARKIAETQDRWDLITINPGLVVGPGLNPNATSESFNLIANFGNGKMRFGVPDYGVALVDVRDVAEAHYQAGVRPEASGRYLVTAHNTNFPEIGRVLKQHFGRKYPFPPLTSPKPIVWLVGPLLDSSLTRRNISRNVGYPMKADNSKSRHELGIEYRPMEESLVEFFQQLIDTKAV